ncbi:unnamed protein product [Lathyrus sativus]|nr:unnamed protein product [Lathyrus sativus]
MNEACLDKLGWQMLHDDDSLCKQIILGKYARQNDYSNWVAKNTDSSFLKNMAKIWPKIVKHSMWYVGNGLKIDA